MSPEREISWRSIIVGTIIRVNRICQQDATISRLLNKELLFQNVSHAKSLIKLACSPITGYFGPYQLPTLSTPISTRYYVYSACLHLATIASIALLVEQSSSGKEGKTIFI